MSTIVTKLGRRVQELRTKNGLTQSVLAERADITQHTLSRVERGQSGVSLDVLQRLASGLGVSVSRLMDFDGEFESADALMEAALSRLPADPARLRERVTTVVRALLAPEE